LAAAIDHSGAEIAIAAASEGDQPHQQGHIRLRLQPVFCLMSVQLLPCLRQFIERGGRKVGAWAAEHRCTTVPFDWPGDNPRAFSNANTLAELRQLESFEPL
jgi:molybdopterin-guanine dinucleotide biosynthesis protein A